MKKLFYFLILLLPMSLLAQNNKKRKSIVFLGDSITEGYGVSPSTAYPNQLQLLLDKKGYKVKIVASGISGSTTASAVSRLKWLLKSKPDIVVIALGGNDGLRGAPLKSSQQNLDKAIKLCLDNKVKVVLAGMKIPVNYGKKYRKQFEAIYTDLAKKYKIKLIPFLLEGVGGNPKLNLADGIHPNELGHKKIAEHILPYLEPLI